MFALILAGGTGTRLWPRSRTAMPKQLLPLLGGTNQSMMQATVNRVLPIVPYEHIFVATNPNYGELIHQQIPGLPRQNIIEEPSGKNTAPGIALAAAHMRRLDSNAVMASLHSDHFIANEEGFRQALLAAEEVARQGYLVTLGIKPNKPETGYGYVQRSTELGQFNTHTVYEVERFLEKPDLAAAEKFVASGEYYWNSGIFVWQLSTLYDSFSRYMPQFFDQLGQMEQAITAGQSIEAIWQDIQAVSIDVGVMERAEKVAVIPVDFGWNDVGSWAALYEINQPDENGNVILETEHFGINTKNTLVDGHNRLVTTIGLENIVIVDTEDALLVCAKDKVQDIKQIVNWLSENKRTDLL